MALTAHTIPTIVSGAILDSLKENLVYSRLFNTDYLGDVRPGNAVKIPSIGSVTVDSYASYTDMTDQEVEDASLSMAIDQQKYFSLVIDDIDSAMAKPNVLAAYAREAAFQLQKTIDGYLSSVLVAGGTLTTGLGDSTTPIEVNSANIASQLFQMSRMLDEALVPRGDRFAILPPWAVEKLTLAAVNVATANGDALANGAVGRFAGFNVLMSPLVPNTTAAKYKIVAGANLSATYAVAIDKSEIIRHPTQFADKLRGLAVYGAKVSRPATLCVATWNKAAEA